MLELNISSIQPSYVKVSISGVRGIYGQDLDLHEVVKFTRSFASMIKSKSKTKCVLARDTRPSGRIIAQTVSAILMESEVDVYNLGVAPTPMAFMEARKYGAGMIVTSSHNPLEWNGLKFIIEGRGPFEDELQTILNYNSSQSLQPQTPSVVYGREFDAYSDYLDEVARMVTDTKKEQTTPKVGIDPGGGAASLYAGQLFKKLGIQSYSVNDVSGISSRGPDPTADELNELTSLVRSSDLDYGFALDLDGDRVVVVINRDKIFGKNEKMVAGDKVEKLNPDATLLLCIARTIMMGMKKFVVSVDTSVVVEKFVSSHGGTLYYSKVGEANVVNKMLDVGAEAGGEGSSSGFILPRFNMCRDAFLASAIISTLDKSVVKECLEFASKYLQIRTKISVDSSLHSQVMEKLPEILQRESSTILTIDGVKAIVDDDSWALVRPSNTEHAIRVSVESTAAKAQALHKKITKEIQRVSDHLKLNE